MSQAGFKVHFERACQTKLPRRTSHGRSLQTSGHRRILQDSSASGLSSTRPVGSQISNHDNRVPTSVFITPTTERTLGEGQHAHSVADVGQHVSSSGQWNSPVPSHERPPGPLALECSNLLQTEKTSVPRFFFSHVPVAMLQL